MIGATRSEGPLDGAVPAMALTPSTMLPLGTALPLEQLLQKLTPVWGGGLDGEALAGRPNRCTGIRARLAGVTAAST